MIQFIKAKLQRWRAKQQREDLVYYIDMLKGAEIGAIAMIVATATDFRNTVMRSPEFLKAQAAGTDVLFLHEAYKSAQGANLQHIAVGIAVWIHTLRTEKEISNRYIVKEMWALLASSFEEVEEAAETLTLIMGGPELNIGGYDLIPLGFS
jgi:hypothetical protein